MKNTPLLFENGVWKKRCAVCPNFITHRYKSQIRQNTCSHSCQLKGNGFRKGKKPANAFTRDQVFGDRNNKWRGDDVGYFAVHDWIKREYGSPLKCEQCGFESDRNMQFNWANVSKKYKRDRSDWLRLCRKCHHKYDRISEKLWATRKANRAKINL